MDASWLATEKPDIYVVAAQPNFSTNNLAAFQLGQLVSIIMSILVRSDMRDHEVARDVQLSMLLGKLTEPPPRDINAETRITVSAPTIIDVLDDMLHKLQHLDSSNSPELNDEKHMLFPLVIKLAEQNGRPIQFGGNESDFLSGMNHLNSQLEDAFATAQEILSETISTVRPLLSPVHSPLVLQGWGISQIIPFFSMICTVQHCTNALETYAMAVTPKSKKGQCSSFPKIMYDLLRGGPSIVAKDMERKAMKARTGQLQDIPRNCSHKSSSLFLATFVLLLESLMPVVTNLSKVHIVLADLKSCILSAAEGELAGLDSLQNLNDHIRQKISYIVRILVSELHTDNDQVKSSIVDIVFAFSEVQRDGMSSNLMGSAADVANTLLSGGYCSFTPVSVLVVHVSLFIGALLAHPDGDDPDDGINHIPWSKLCLIGKNGHSIYNFHQFVQLRRVYDNVHRKLVPSSFLAPLLAEVKVADKFLTADMREHEISMPMLHADTTVRALEMRNSKHVLGCLMNDSQVDSRVISEIIRVPCKPWTAQDRRIEKIHITVYLMQLHSTFLIVQDQENVSFSTFTQHPDYLVLYPILDAEVSIQAAGLYSIYAHRFMIKSFDLGVVDEHMGYTADRDKERPTAMGYGYSYYMMRPMFTEALGTVLTALKSESDRLVWVTNTNQQSGSLPTVGSLTLRLIITMKCMLVRTKNTHPFVFQIMNSILAKLSGASGKLFMTTLRMSQRVKSKAQIDALILSLRSNQLFVQHEEEESRDDVLATNDPSSSHLTPKTVRVSSKRKATVQLDASPHRIPKYTEEQLYIEQMRKITTHHTTKEKLEYKIDRMRKKMTKAMRSITTRIGDGAPVDVMQMEFHQLQSELLELQTKLQTLVSHIEMLTQHAMMTSPARCKAMHDSYDPAQLYPAAFSTRNSEDLVQTLIDDKDVQATLEDLSPVAELGPLQPHNSPLKNTEEEDELVELFLLTEQD